MATERRTTPALPLANPENIWEGYDPDAVRRGIREYAGSIPASEGDAAIDELYRAREVGTRPTTRP